MSDEEFEAMIQEVPPFYEEDYVPPIIDELNKANKKISDLYHFIEMTEALTYDDATRARIRSFLKEEGIWPKN